MRRRTVLGVLLGLVALVAIRYVLPAVVGTVFFALTVAYVATPLFDALERRGIPARVASGLTTLSVFLAIFLVTGPLVLILYRNQAAIRTALEELPESLAVDVAGYQATVPTNQVIDFAVVQLQAIAIRIAAVTPVLLFKMGLFVLAVYGVLLGKNDIRRALYAVVPSEYHSIVQPLERRVGATLWGIYVLQAVTAVGTFLVAMPVFWGLGYDSWLPLSAISAVLQFIPILGPSVLLGGLAIYHVTMGQVSLAVTVLLVGGLVIGWLPDGVIRPRLADHTTNLSGTLYFVGFVGGLLSMGAVGVIAGPLIVAVIAELVSQLAAELREPPPSDGGLPQFAEQESTEE